MWPSFEFVGEARVVITAELADFLVGICANKIMWLDTA
jgi:hypothetical protein